ncbi:MAG: sel1 repeat family protein, partial [Methylocystaceae bacterium]|nr:sel1 repeat family protein [Methylocystaceae bacterium]
DSMFALNLAHLLFTKAQTPIEKKEALSGVRDILLDHITLVETGYELEKYIGILYPNSPAFLSALSSEFDFFKSIDANPSLKLNQSEKLMEEGHFPDVAKFWLGQLTQKDNPRANYLYAKYFDGNLKFYSGFLRSAAKQGIPEAQIALADIHAKKGTAVGYRFAYFWYLKAAQNGTDVKEQLNLLKEKLSKNDISIIEGEVLNKDSTYQ